MSRIRKVIFGWPGLLLWSAILVIVVYGQAIRFPFLADDFFQFPFVDEHNLFEIWGTAAGLQYYRPLSFTVWKALAWLGGGHHASVLHAVNLLLHLANGLLVAWLAGRLRQELPDQPLARIWARRYLAASLFLLYPFSYQAVSWIAAMMHPLVTFLVLASFGCYLLFVQSGRRFWGVLSLALAFLAPFAHEIGVIVAPLLLGFELIRPAAAASLWRRVGRAAVWMIPAVLWAVIWRSVPAYNTGTLLANFSLSDLWPNMTYAGQAIAYPATWTGARLAAIGSAGEFTVVALITLVTLAAALILLFVPWRREDRMTLFACYWIIVAMAPAVLFIPFRWMSASPRVLMLASAGLAWFWAEVFIRLADRVGASSGPRRLAPALVALVAVLLLWQGAYYIRLQTRLYALAGSAIDQLVEATVAAAARGRPAIFINFPSWLAPPQNNYALGEDGVLVLGDYSELEKLVTHYTGQPAAIAAVESHAIRQEVPYHVGLTGPGLDWSTQAQTGDEIYVTRYDDASISIHHAGTLEGDLSGQEPLADFEGLITLVSARATVDAGDVTVVLTWQVQEDAPQDVTVFVHLVDANGQLTGQVDGDPLFGAYPFWLWERGAVVQDRRTQPASGVVAALIGLYSRATGERLHPQGATGSWPNDAVAVEIDPAE